MDFKTTDNNKGKKKKKLILRNKYKLDCGWKEETFDGGVCKRRTRLKTNHVDREKRSYPTKKKKVKHT